MVTIVGGCIKALHEPLMSLSQMGIESGLSTFGSVDSFQSGQVFTSQRALTFESSLVEVKYRSEDTNLDRLLCSNRIQWLVGQNAN